MHHLTFVEYEFSVYKWATRSSVSADAPPAFIGNTIADWSFILIVTLPPRSSQSCPCSVGWLNWKCWLSPRKKRAWRWTAAGSFYAPLSRWWAQGQLSTCWRLPQFHYLCLPPRLLAVPPTPPGEAARSTVLKASRTGLFAHRVVLSPCLSWSHSPSVGKCTHPLLLAVF